MRQYEIELKQYVFVEAENEEEARKAGETYNSVISNHVANCDLCFREDGAEAELLLTQQDLPERFRITELKEGERIET